MRELFDRELPWQRDLTAWERVNIRRGCYVGRTDLAPYGFRLHHGDYVPVDARYSAMLGHRAASRAADRDVN